MKFIVNTWNSISMVGIPESISASDIKRIKLTNRFGVIAVFFTLPYIIGFYFYGFSNLGLLLCLLSCLYLSTVYFNYLKLHNGAKLVLYLTVLVHQFIVASVFGEAAEIHLMYMALILLPVVLYDYKKDAVWISFYVTITIIAISVLYATHFSLLAGNFSDSVIRTLNIAYKISTMAGVIVILSAMMVVADKTEKIFDKDKSLLEYQLKVLFDSSYDALFIVNVKEQQVVRANKRAVELFEVADTSVFYEKRFYDFRKDKPSEELVNKMKTSLLEKDFYEGEVLYKTAKGNEFWGALAIRMTFIGNIPYQTIRVTDISAQKRSEKEIHATLNEKEVLLAEIHHRVKNNMAVISGLLGLQSMYVEDKKSKLLFEESRNRIHSMALIHDKLYQHEQSARIDFSAYIKSLVDHIKNSYNTTNTDVKFTVTCNDIYLDIKNAIPCGLILNELVSNSFKHAFKERSAGEIKIVCTKMGERFTMMVSDDGVGYDIEGNLKESKSLGITLINALVDQVNGSVKTTCQEGTAYYISFEV